MAGSHRATHPKEPVARSGHPSRKKAPARLSRRSVAIAAGVALLPALWLGSQKVLDDGTGGGSNDKPIPDVTSTRTPSGSPTPSAAATTPSRPATTAAPALTRIAASGPRRLTVRGLDVGFDDSIEARSGGFQAASTAEAARWGSRGTPASPGTDTVFLIGKVYTRGASAFAGLTGVRTGDVITLRTQSGAVLRYTVTSSTPRPASGLLRRPEFTQEKPGRLVLVGILFDRRDDQRTGKYQVVVAQLTGAQKG
ncbi:MAG: class F sortase [Propionibacteriales bacterium]|nr:class F sortase [Propionibacteriales bacterium]